MTDKTIKRKSTYIKKAGSEAWRWLSAEDSFVSEEQPVGVSFYQRNDTYRQYRNSRNTPPKRNSSNISQFLNQSYFKNLTSSEQSYTSVDIEEPKDDDEVKRPEPAVEKQKNESDPNKRKNLKIPSALYDPEVRRQIQQMKRHIPYFMVTITIVQIAILIFAIGRNYSVTGKFIASLDENPMVGPYPSVCIIISKIYSLTI